MKIIIVTLLSFCTSFVYAQSTPGPDGRLMRDTNRVVYNEQGRIVKYSEYKNLLASGEYIVAFNGDPLLPNTKSILRKLTVQDKQRKADAMDGVILNTRILKLNSQLDATPLALALQKDLFSNKVILMVFSNPGCLACGDMFPQINKAIQDYGQDSIVVLLITENTKEKAAEALAQQPLANARIVERARDIKESFGITALPAFVIADQNRTIRYNAFGIGPSQALRVKNVLDEIKDRVHDGHYTLTYDQRHLILSVKAINLMKESKYHEAAQVYEGLFTNSMGKGLQQDYYNAASAWAKLGDADKAFHYLKQAVYVTKYTSLSTLNNEPNFSKLKPDMRWKAIADQVNINLKEKLASGAKR